MKVVQINGSSYNGSTGKIVRQLSEIMDEKGINNYIISSGYKEKLPIDNRTYYCSNKLQVRIHQVFSFIFGDAGFHSWLPTYKVIKVLSIIKPDIVHLHNLHGFFINVEMLIKYLKKERIKVVWTLHDCWLLTGHCTHFEHIGCQKWKKECGHCPQLNKYPYSYFIDRSKELLLKKKRLIQDWDDIQFVTVSRWLKNLMEESHLKSKLISVIHNGIDLEVFSPKDNQSITKKFEISGKFVVLGVAMNWSEGKGLNDFIELSKHLSDDVRIILIGLNKDQIKDLPNNIIGVERTYNVQELVEYYCVANVFVNLTKEDTFPTVNLEALACGTPVITYDTGGSSECLGERCGFVVEKENLYEVLNRIEYYKNLSKKTISKYCRKNIELNFNKSKQFNKYINLYEELDSQLKGEKLH